MEAPQSRIVAVRFRVQTDEDRRRMSRAVVRAHDLFAGESPVPKGLYDPHMGSTDQRYLCLSCGLTSKTCPGHPGSVELPYPVLLPYAISEVRQWLRVACMTCGAVVVDLTNPRVTSAPRGRRLAEAANLTYEGVPCPSCQAVHPKVLSSEEDNFSFLYELPGKGGGLRRVPLYPFQIEQVLQRISAEAVKALGRDPELTHPRFLTMRVLAVPPVSIRPGIRMNGPAGHGASCHDINSILQYIVRAVEKAPAWDRRANFDPRNPGMAMPPSLVLESMVTLQELVFNLIVGSGSASNKGRSSRGGKRSMVVSGRAAQSIMRRLPGKKGRLRRHQLGTRVWSVARNTITGNCDIHPNSVAIPLMFARTLQIREYVQPENMSLLMQFYLNGRRQYPGATRVMRASTGTIHDVEGLLRSNQTLEPGDVLWRDLVTGDKALFNRQPSLERSSISMHNVVVMRGSDEEKSSGKLGPLDPQSTQFNVVSTTLYNADFDGDEMNLIPVDTPAMVAETEILSSVGVASISTKSSLPVLGTVQDSTVGACLVSRMPGMCKLYLMSLFESNGLPPPDLSDLAPVADLSSEEATAATTLDGRAALSLLLRHAPISLNSRPTWYSNLVAGFKAFDPRDTRIVIERGTVVSGVLDKKTVGGGAGGGVFHRIARSFGPNESINVLSALQKMTIKLLDQRGFTVSFADMIMPDSVNDETRRIVAGMLRESEAINERLMRNQIVPPLGMTTHHFYESLQKEALKTPDEVLGGIYRHMDLETNGFYQMINTGSKGNPKNAINICAVVGQTNLRDARIEAHEGGIGRTLAYFPRGDMSPAASGFVPDCYANGLTALGHYFGSMIGRNDLTNKALTTAVTGYTNRKSIMALQSMIVGPLRYVWAAPTGAGIAQPLYGDDGMDARQVEPVKFRTAFMSDAALRDAFGLADAAGKDAAWHAAEIAQLFADRDSFREVFLKIEESSFSVPVPGSIPLAVNVASVARDVFGGREDAAAPDAGALKQMHAMVGEFCAKLVYLLLNSRMEKEGKPAPAHMSAAVEMLRRVVRVELSSRVLLDMKATPELLLMAFDAIRMRYLRSLVSPGEAVGVLASQAVSEPLTQYMLDSHHRSVSGGTSKAGIVRPQEIFGAREISAEKSSEMLLRGLAPDASGRMVRTNDRAVLQGIADNIKVLSLAQVTRSWTIVYEPFPHFGGAGQPAGAGQSPSDFVPAFAGDQAWMKEFMSTNPLLSVPSDLTMWCYRVVLNRAELMMKSISLETVVARLRSLCPFAFFVHSPEGATAQTPDPVLRAYLRANVFSRSSSSNYASNPAVKAAIKAATASIPPRGIRSPDERTAEGVFTGMSNSPLRGVPGISNAFVEKVVRHHVGEDGALTSSNNDLAVRAIGTNLPGVLMYEAVEAKTAVTSSIGDVIRTLGLEAGRACIIREIARVMGGRTPNWRHLQIYAGQMTRTGTYTSLEHGGIKKREASNILLRAATHGPIPVLTRAPLENTVNPVYGMACPQVLGSVPMLGTNTVDLIIDEEFVRSKRKSLRQILDDL